MNSELYCKECQLTKITLPEQCPNRFTAPGATMLMTWKPTRMVLKRKKNPSAVQLMFQKGNAQELQMGLNVLFKTQKTQRALCSTPPHALRLGMKRHSISVKHK